MRRPMNTIPWESLASRIILARDIENDMQDVFSTALPVGGEKLEVSTEVNQAFETGISSGKVWALTPLNGRWRFR